MDPFWTIIWFNWTADERETLDEWVYWCLEAYGEGTIAASPLS